VFPQQWVGWHDPTAWVGVGLVAAAGAAAYARRAAVPLVTWGLVSGVTALVPVLVLPFQTNVALFQPHRGYQAAVGLAVATAAVAEALVRRAGSVRPVGRVVGLALGAAMVVAAIIIDVRAGRLWRDEVEYWTAAVTRYPSEAAYHHSLGAARLRAGDPSGAVEAFMSAARWDPLLPRVDFNLGLVYTKLGRDAEAIAAYERAVTRDSTDVKSLANLGALYERVGDPDRAVGAYGKALAADPSLVPIQRRLARLSKVPRTGVGGLEHPAAGQ
jgi:tetratricopeptide (TPR) repeat protein